MLLLILGGLPFQIKEHILLSNELNNDFLNQDRDILKEIKKFR